MSEQKMSARAAALTALYQTEQEGAYFNKALNDALGKVSGADKALVTELLYGITKRRLTLDYIITKFSKIRLKKMTPWILNILRMGIYQIYFMDKIPTSAACNEAVKLAKKHAHPTAVKFVNGVLRSAARGVDTFEYPSRDNLSEYFSVFYSYPLWLTEKLISQYGAEDCESILAAFNAPSSATLRVNRLKISADDLITVLDDEGIRAERDCALPDCLRVKGRIDIAHSNAYGQGLYSLQSGSSMQAVLALDPQPGETVMDLCAAPGGKSCYIAERMSNTGKVLSYDLHPHKIELINNSAKRLGIDIISAKAQDSTLPMTDELEYADRVLADVPCSGLGVISTKPDIKWTHREDDIAAISEVQAKILETAGSCVKPNGILVYSTCTILKEENEERIADFLSKHTEFEKCGETTLLPHQNNGSGFYICKMRKIK